MQRRRQPMQKSIFLAYFCALQNRMLDKPARSAIYAGLNFGEQGCRCEPSTDATTVRGGPAALGGQAEVLSTVSQSWLENRASRRAHPAVLLQSCLLYS